MNPYGQPITNRATDLIREVLMVHWNPLGVSPESREEYDAYVRPIFEILTSTRSDEQLAKLLHKIVVEEMEVWDGFFPARKNRRIAQRLLEIPADDLTRFDVELE